MALDIGCKLRNYPGMKKPLLQILLHNRDLRMVDLARRLGVDKATVTRWARKGVPAERVADIVRVTGIPAADLRSDLATVFTQPAPSPTEAASA